MPRKNSFITLLTDFGSEDYFVSAMKGVIFSIAPGITVIDVTHSIPPQKIEPAAFTLLAAHRSFPRGTINVAVVDPGVGSSRRSILIAAGKQFFVGPDNGIFSYILDIYPSHKVFHLTNEKYFAKNVSNSFHGRDIFAPVAAWLSRGVTPKNFGKGLTDAVRLPTLQTQKDKKGRLVGRIIQVDHFGNCVTNITRKDLSEAQESLAALVMNGKQIRSFRKYFADAESNDNVFCIWGSAGFLEIAAQNESAANLLNVKTGEPLLIEFRK
jgi:S-adenosylmethionine hydrolase